MAPLSFTLATTIPCSPFHSATAPQQRRLKTHAKQTRRFQVSCNVSSDDHEKTLIINPHPQKLILPETPDWQNVDRRNLLLGLGGLYSTVSVPSAFAEAIKSPSFVDEKLYEPTCKEAGSGFNASKGLLRSTACCPPASTKSEEAYKLTDRTTRIRKPLHTLSEDEIKKYRNGIAQMRALPDDDPRSFKNQAKIHCAYCNGSYIQTGSKQELQIHNSWLFFPFHRWYLYFFERILGHFIGDEEFGLPYWNWDNPEGGMVIPAFFVDDKVCDTDELNPLYDIYRNSAHLRYEVADLDYSGSDRNLCFDQKEINQNVMNRQMMRNAFDATSFFGGRYVAGDEPIQRGDNVVGSIEAGCHTAIHRWVGDPKSPNGEDMGNFYSAGYDPLFYAHHSNVDRMWTLWKKPGSKSHTEPKEKDWKDASYVFYDENQNPVRVTNEMCVNLIDLKYEYKESETSWMNKNPISGCPKSDTNPRPTKKVTDIEPKEFKYLKAEEFPLALPTTVRLRVLRPAACRNRTTREKDTKKEILCFNGINFDGTSPVKFDVFVNDCDDKVITPCDSEYVGAFAAVPHAKGMAMGCKSGMRFALTELLQETDAEGDEYIRVTIVPKTNGNNVTIEAIDIQLIDIS